MKRNLATALVESFQFGTQAGLFCAIRTPENDWFIGSGKPNSNLDAPSAEQRGVFEIRRFDANQAAGRDPHWGSLPAVLNFCPELRPLWREQIPAAEFTEIRQAFAKISEKKIFPFAQDSELSLASWKSLHAHALASLNTTDLQKLVISRYRDRACTLAPHEILARLLTLTDQESFLFFLRYGDLTFFGLSPESILRWDQSGIKTHALAGTLPLGQESTANSLLQDTKERAEHEAVVSGILQTFCDFNLPAERSAPALKHARGLTHIVSNIHSRGEFSSEKIQALVAALHPTPATCGLPQSRALAWLREHEIYDRGWYCGTVGVRDSFGGESIVALRSAALREGKLRLFAGAGVVPGSIAEREYQEINAKFGTIEKFISGENL